MMWDHDAVVVPAGRAAGYKKADTRGGKYGDMMCYTPDKLAKDAVAEAAMPVHIVSAARDRCVITYLQQAKMLAIWNDWPYVP